MFPKPHQLLPAALLASLFAALPLGAQPVTVGKYPAKIVPEQVAILNLGDRGIITDLADSSQRLEKGSIIAIVNKEQTEEEREDMELQLARERITKRDEVQKLKSQRRKVEFYLSLTEGERKYNTDFNDGELPPTDESLRDIDERLDLLDRELRTIERRKRAEFDKKHDSLTLRMPFTGKLQYNITLPEDKSKPFEAPQGNVQNFATVCDDSAFYITLSISNSDLTILPEEQFSATISLPGNRKLSGTYSHRRVERAGSDRDALIYFFKLPLEDHETAFNLMGSNATATLTYETGHETNTLLVSKAALAAHPEAASCENWQQLAERVYPGYHILLIAEQDIVLCQDTP